MANNVSNKLTIKCQDPDIMDRIKKMIFRPDKNNNQEFTMEILLPRSMVFADEKKYDLYWNKALWGTERDVYYYSIIDSGSTITLVYATAWNPNRGWVETLCCYLDHFLRYYPKRNTTELEIEHRYSDYPGNFGGIVSWKPGIKFAYIHYDSYMEYLKNHNPETYQSMYELDAEMKSVNSSVLRISIPT
jgi:hypothetical protein